MPDPTPHGSTRSLTVEEALKHAVACHQAGRLQDAERLYRGILQAQPKHPDANHNLGVLTAKLGQVTPAIAFFRAAIEASPHTAQYWLSYVNALIAAGDAESAVEAIGLTEKHQVPASVFAEAKEKLAALRRVPASAPNRIEEEHLVTLYDQRRYAEVEAQATALTRRFPNHAFAWNLLAMARLQVGRSEDALPPAQKAVQLQPQLAALHNNLAAILKDLGRLKEAEESCRRSLQIQPDYFEGQLNLATITQRAARWDEAEIWCRRAVQLRPGSADAHRELGETLRALGRLPEAEVACRRAIQINPSIGETHAALGAILADGKQLEAAIASYQAGLELNPTLSEAYNNLGGALKDLGRVDEAVASYRRALAIKPTFAVAHSNLLLCLNYLPRITATELYREHRQWGERLAKSVGDVTRPRIDQAPNRRLRIGFLSADFRQHSVAFFFEPVLRELNRAAFEVSCYAEVLKPDAVTLRLQQLADHWLSTVGYSDAEVVQRIIADGIDILVDLAGHTGGNRLRVFAAKPAPVQISWLGYPNTTGLTAMDYRLVDEITDPSGAADGFATERLVRLEGGFLCYAPPEATPAPASRPKGTGITFGSFNNPAKISAIVLETWAAILKRVPNSRLLLKGRPFHEALSRQSFLARMERCGIEIARVGLIGDTATLEEHWARYAEIDIALDTFPYNGTTTTCEALWMGVPVVTTLGDRHAGRVGASLLTSVGSPELIAGSPSAYIDVAAELASDAKRLTAYRLGLRDRLLASALCDANRFARKIEATLRTLWHDYCARAENSSETR